MAFFRRKFSGGVVEGGILFATFLPAPAKCKLKPENQQQFQK